MVQRLRQYITPLFIISFISSTQAAHITTTQNLSTDSSPTPTALRYAINGYLWAIQHNAIGNKSILTVIDFTQPSYKKRMWVINLKNNQIIMAMNVAQGKNSGQVYAKRFSNSPGSHETSPGIYVTEGKYDGHHGSSLRINGLEKGINSNAMERAIVIHSAWYVSSNFIQQNGYAGRSWGCFAVDPAVAPKFINNTKNGTVLFAYSPSEDKDPNVNHGLSSQGEAMYHAILSKNDDMIQHKNPIAQFFGAIRALI